MVLLAGQHPATLAGKLTPEILANLHRRNADYSLKRWLPKITRSFTITKKASIRGLLHDCKILGTQGSAHLCLGYLLLFKGSLLFRY